MARFLLLITIFFSAVPVARTLAQEKENAVRPDFQEIIFPSLDTTSITARLYVADKTDKGNLNSSKPFIVLCHQAGWSRGEYQEIAPKLVAMGFNCMAIDQRSGGAVNDVVNQTAGKAKAAGKPDGFVDAEQDILAALQYARTANHARGKLILWGSSYSAALVLRIAGEHPDLIDGVLAFAPGEYFGRFEKPKDWITQSAKKITAPAFVTSAKNEYPNWSTIFEAIPGDNKVKFVPETKGNHGSRALWEKFNDSDDYWNATRGFLKQFQSASSDAPHADGHASKESVLRIADIQGLPARIAFGSCGHQDKPQPVLTTIVNQDPDLFIYLGDNIYGDTKDMNVLQKKYGLLAAKPEFQNLRSKVPVLSVWDDHDYGWNDAGKEYEFKSESKEIFMDFWQVPDSDPRRSHDGIYGSHRFESDGHVLQIILLDTRTFRDPLKRNKTPLPEGSAFKNEYQPDPDQSKTLLGNEQWQWLENQLRQTADIRIICSSIQFGHEYNGWESWTNLPVEQSRMVQLIRETGAGGVLFISGDVHWGEISKRNFEDLYPLFDVTASGLTERWYNVEPNQYRMGKAVRDNHFGVIEIDWQRSDPTITFEIVDISGTIRTKHQLLLSDLKRP